MGFLFNLGLGTGLEITRFPPVAVLRIRLHVLSLSSTILTDTCHIRREYSWEPSLDQSENSAVARQWIEKVRAFVPGYLDAHPALAPRQSRASIMIHGSTTLGIVDDASDLDLWLLLPEADVVAIDAAVGTRFFEFRLDGKKGHLNACDARAFAERAQHCDMDCIYQLRHCEVLADSGGVARDVIERARQPMSEAVRQAFFFHHYVEMRGEHRACDSPIDRNQPVPLLLFLGKTIGHALRAAMVLDGQPYPYDKWLHRAAGETETGRLAAAEVDTIVSLLAQDHLRTPGPEASHPITRALIAIRNILIEAAHAKACDGPWLNEWWLYMEAARRAVNGVRW